MLHHRFSTVVFLGFFSQVFRVFRSHPREEWKMGGAVDGYLQPRRMLDPTCSIFKPGGDDAR